MAFGELKNEAHRGKSTSRVDGERTSTTSVAKLAMSNRIPAICHLRQFVEAAGLISYRTDYVESFQQAAVLVAKILKGAKPAESARTDNPAIAPAARGSGDRVADCDV